MKSLKCRLQQIKIATYTPLLGDTVMTASIDGWALKDEEFEEEYALESSISSFCPLGCGEVMGTGTGTGIEIEVDKGLSRILEDNISVVGEVTTLLTVPSLSITSLPYCFNPFLSVFEEFFSSLFFDIFFFLLFLALPLKFSSQQVLKSGCSARFKVIKYIPSSSNFQNL